MEENVVKILHDLHIADQLVIFVGAGVSKNSGCPDWSHLIKIMIEDMGLYTKEELEEQKFNFYDYTKYAQFYYNNDAEKYYKLLKDTFDGSFISSNIHKDIMKMNQSDIFTTNYDNLLETSTTASTSLYNVIKENRDLLVQDYNKKIVKLHGDITDLKSIILKEDDYLNYKSSKKIINTYARSRLYSKVALFIGYGLADYNIKELLNDIEMDKKDVGEKRLSSERVHYLLTHREDDDKNWDHNMELLYKRGVITIDVKQYSKEKNKHHSERIGGENRNKDIESWYCFFINSIVGHTMYLSNFDIVIEQIEKRIEIALQQDFISVVDIENIFELEKRSRKPTFNTIYLYNVELFSHLREQLDAENESIYLKLFSKTLIEHICLCDESHREVDRVTRDSNGSDEILKRIVNNISDEIIKRIPINNLLRIDYDSIVENSDKFQQILNRGENNRYRVYVQNINDIIIRHKSPSYLVESEKYNSIEDKVNLLSKGLEYESGRTYSHLFKISSYRHENYIKSAFRIYDIIEKDVNKLNGSFSTNIDYCGILYKIIDDVFTYSLLNGLIIEWFYSDFQVLANIVTKALFAPFSSKYQNKVVIESPLFINSKAFAHLEIDMRCIFFICIFLPEKKLHEVLKNNVIRKVNITADFEILLEFLFSYQEKLKEGEGYGINLHWSPFIRNLVTIMTLHNDFDLDATIKVLQGDSVSITEYTQYLCELKNHNLDSYIVSEDLANDLIYKIYSNVDHNQIHILFDRMQTIIFSNANNISPENIELLNGFIVNKKIYNIDKFILPFLDILNLSEKIMKNIEKFGAESLVNLFKFEAIDEDTLLERLSDIIMKDKNKNFPGRIISNFADEIYYLLQRVFSRVDEVKLYNFFLSDIDKREDEYNIIKVIIRNNFNSKMLESPNFYEVELIERFMKNEKIRDMINCKWIIKELLRLEKESIITNSGYYLLGIVRYMQ